MFKRFDISFLVPGMQFDGRSLETRSLGGSESAALYMAKALARRGARLRLFCNTADISTDCDDVVYSPLEHWSQYARVTPHDICVVQRMSAAFNQRTNARLNVLWCHDMALARDEKSIKASMWNIDRIVVLSRFMAEQYERAYQIDRDIFFQSRNGIDLKAFDDLECEGIRHDPTKLVFAGRPERGLDLLLGEIMPRVLQAAPHFRLYLAGYDNTTDEWQPFYNRCQQLAARLGDRVVNLGHLSKSELYRLYLSAGAYVYPTPSPEFKTFREVSCITAMECQAAGLPIVTSAAGALPETIVGGAGILLDLPGGSASSRSTYIDQFVESIFRVTDSEHDRRSMANAGQQHARSLDWSTIADEWLREFEHSIRVRNESPARLVRHFWRTSDIVAAKQLLSTSVEVTSVHDDERERLQRLLSGWSFMEADDGYRHLYEALGARALTDDQYRAQEEVRFELLDHWLREHTDEIQTVLDYGCAHGAYAIALAERLENLKIHGVDIDQSSVSAARHWAAKRGVTSRTSFSTWTHDMPGPALRGDAAFIFDCALAQEVLEHVAEPWTVLESVEKQVRLGGKVYITVPFGPWEFTSYRWHPERCHIWHFDSHDLRDMLGRKRDLTVDAVPACNNPLTGEPQGWWIVTYTVDHKPLGPINMDRHMWLQRPRQSVSATVIAGAGAEATLHWALRSIQDIADQIIISDIGMSAEARRIADQYDATVIRAETPALIGFDDVRNAALELCSSDWSLWIDVDERLVGADELEKYLRANPYQSYALRQHRFSCDTASVREVPIRLFRRSPRESQVIKFWGAVHERPELAINEGAGPNIAISDVHIAHIGQLEETARQERFMRDWALLQLDIQKHPGRLVQKHFMMRANMNIVRGSLSANGGVSDPAIRERCRNTIKLYQEHFLGKPQVASQDSLRHYSDALAVLGEGFEAAFQIEADRTQAKANGTRRYRFASREDFLVELERAALEKLGRLDSEEW